MGGGPDSQATPGSLPATAVRSEVAALALAGHQGPAVTEEDTEAGAGGMAGVVVVVAGAVPGVVTDGLAGLLTVQGVGQDVQDVLTVSVALVGQATQTVGLGLRHAVLAGAGGGAVRQVETHRLVGRALTGVVRHHTAAWSTLIGPELP